MSVIIRLQNLPLTANSINIRNFFRGLSIPDGGVHIVGGSEGDAFIAFSTDEDARQAMQLSGNCLKDLPVKLLLSSRNEMYKVIEQARQQALGLMPGQSSGNSPSQSPADSSTTTSSLSASSNLLSSNSGQLALSQGNSNLTSGNQSFVHLSQNQMLPNLGLTFPSTLTAGGGSSNNASNNSLNFPSLVGPLLNSNMSMVPNNFSGGGMGPQQQQQGFPMMSPQQQQPVAGLFSNPPPTSSTLPHHQGSRNMLTPMSHQQSQNPFAIVQGGPPIGNNSNIPMSGFPGGHISNNNTSLNNNVPPPSTTVSSLIGLPNSMPHLQGPTSNMGGGPGQFGLGNNRMLGMNNMTQPSGGHLPFNSMNHPQQRLGADEGGFHGMMNSLGVNSGGGIGNIRGPGLNNQTVGGGPMGGGGGHVPRPNFMNNQNQQQSSKSLVNPNIQDRLNESRGNRHNFDKNSGGPPFGPPHHQNQQQSPKALVNPNIRDRLNESRGSNSHNFDKNSGPHFGPPHHQRDMRENSGVLLSNRGGGVGDRNVPVMRGGDRDLGNRGRDKERIDRGKRSQSRSRERKERIRRRSRSRDRRSRSRSRERRRAARRSRNRSKSRDRGKGRGASSREKDRGREERRKSDAGSSGSPEKTSSSTTKTASAENTALFKGVESDTTENDKKLTENGQQAEPIVITISDDTFPSNKLTGKDTSFREDLQRAKRDSFGSGRVGSNNRERDNKNLAETKSLFELDIGMDMESSSVIISGAPPNTTDRNVVDFFSEIGIIPMNVEILYDPRGTPTGQVLCEFQDPHKARRATTKDGMMFGRSSVHVSLLPSASRGNINLGGPGVPNFPNSNNNGRALRPALLGSRPPHSNSNNPRFPNNSNNNNNNSQNPFTQALQQSSMPNASNANLMNSVPTKRMRGPGERTSRFSNSGSNDPPPNIDRDDRPKHGAARQDEVDIFSNPGCVLALENVPFKASMDDILNFLKDILGIQIPRSRIIRRYDEMQKPTGDARVAFATPFEAKLAHQRLVGSTMWKRPISISILNFF